MLAPSGAMRDIVLKDMEEMSYCMQESLPKRKVVLQVR